MRCLSCNEILTDLEAVRKFSGSGSYSDLCESCFSAVCADLLDLDVLAALGPLEGLALDMDQPVVVSSVDDLGDVGDEDGATDNG